MTNLGGPPVEPDMPTISGTRPASGLAAGFAPTGTPAGPADWPAGAVTPTGTPADWPAGVPPYQIAEPDRLTRFVTRLHARSPRWAAPLAALGCMAAAVGYTLLADPTRSAPDAPPTCLLKLTTGLDCPGCGGTRAMWYMLHGDLADAARHHIIWVFVLPFLLYLYVAWAVRQSFGWRLPQLQVTPVMLGVVLAAWLAFSVLRNLPWAPFTAIYV